VQVIGAPALHTFALVAPPHGPLDIRWDKADLLELTSRMPLVQEAARHS